MLDFSRQKFHPVLDLPQDYEVYDFCHGYDPERMRKSEYGIGKYDEKRENMYTAPLFGSEEERRNVHMGIDIAAPVGTPLYAFFAGEVFLFGNNPAAGDYGYTLITKHLIDATPLYALYGHLAASSLREKFSGKKIEAGETIAFIGDRHENGGWNPHLHFQLSLVAPEKCDMPGVVTEAQREQAKRIYPDPRLVLGPLY